MDFAALVKAIQLALGLFTQIYNDLKSTPAELRRDKVGKLDAAMLKAKKDKDLRALVKHLGKIL